MITLRDKLSHLSYQQACRLLGQEGEKLIRAGGKYDIDVTEHVSLSRNRFMLNLGEAVVTIRLDAARKQRFDFRCSKCSRACVHLGAAFSFIAEMFPEQEEAEQSRKLERMFKERLSQCLETGENGKLRMSVTFPDKSWSGRSELPRIGKGNSGY